MNTAIQRIRLTFLINSIRERAPSAIFLFTFFSIAFYFSTYWAIPESRTLRLGLLIVTVVLGAIWAMISAGSFQLNFQRSYLLTAILAFVVVIAFNFLPINTSIPWRGDEDYHIIQITHLFYSVPGYIIIGLILLLFLFPPVVRQHPVTGLILGLLLLSLLMHYFRFARPFKAEGSYYLLRYPFVSYWFAAVVPIIAGYFGQAYYEWSYRLIPMISAAGIVWLILRTIPQRSIFTRMLIAISIATMPVLWYYATIYYLELPAILLMLWVTLNLEKVMKGNLSELKSDNVWIGLLLIGFIKETSIIFLVSLLILRGLYQVYKLFQTKEINTRVGGTNLIQFLVNEAIITLSVLFPLVYYLALRRFLINIDRTYAWAFSNLLDLSTYLTQLKAFILEYSLFFILFIAGIILLFYARQTLKASGLLFLFASVFVFFEADAKAFIGYSRFNLSFLPVILVVAAEAFKALSERWPKLLNAVLGLIILANLLISPIFPDGSKKPYWGIYGSDTSEHYYPYREVFQEIRSANREPVILVTGLWYGYFSDFYFKQMNWFPDIEYILVDEKFTPRDLSKVVTSEDEMKFTHVIYHVLENNQPLIVPDLANFIARPYCNMAHCLVLYTKQ